MCGINRCVDPPADDAAKSPTGGGAGSATNGTSTGAMPGVSGSGVAGSSASTGQGGAGPGTSGQGGAGGGGGSTGGTGGSRSGSDSGARPGADASDATAPRDASDARALDTGGGGFVDGAVGPIVPPDCEGDPTAGWTEYFSPFMIQRPYDLMVSDRYTFENGIHTFWIFPSDNAHEPNNTTAPRTESRYPDFTTGQRMWTADVLVDSPSNTTTIFQVHTSADGAGPVYLRVTNGNVHELGGQTVVNNIYNKWFNLKVAFNAATSSATIYVNNCQKLVLNNSRPGNRDFYFKNGVYTCTSTVCRDHYKNIRLYQR